VTDDLIPGYIVKVIYTTARCTERVNPKRPTWRCKNIATWLWQASEPEPDGRRKADYKCDDHKDRITA
jgi:hypothetical protein